MLGSDLFEEFRNKIISSVNEEGDIVKSKKCSVTGEIYSVTIDPMKYYEWSVEKKLIQDVFPLMSIDDREFLISGFTPQEYENLFGF
jgi:hypothetical protein